jgi:hypothetical protein
MTIDFLLLGGAMRILLLFMVAAFLLPCQPAILSAQAGFVGVYDDTLMNRCQIYDSPGVLEIYVMFGGAPMDGVRFKIEATAGMTMTYLSETHHVPVLEGDTQTGITFCLDEPRYPPILLATVRYLADGTSDTCSEILVVPHPESNTIDVTYGDFVGFTFGKRTIVRLDAWCGMPYCGEAIYYGPPASPYDFCEPVHTQQVSWGEVKSMYR